MKPLRKAAADAVAPIADATAKPAPSATAADEGIKKADDSVSEAAGPVSGLTPTKDPVRNAYGLELDRFGLPVNGPARAAVLARMEVSDPALEPGEWDFRGRDRAAEVMEKIYG
jgi:hypothetical protein